MLLYVLLLVLHNQVMCSSLSSLYLHTVHPFLICCLLICSASLPLFSCSISSSLNLYFPSLTRPEFGSFLLGSSLIKQHTTQVDNVCFGKYLCRWILCLFSCWLSVCVWYIHCNTSQRSISSSFITVATSSMASRTICHDNNNHSSPCQRLQVPRFPLLSLTPSKTYTDTSRMYQTTSLFVFSFTNIYSYVVFCF